MNKQPKIIFVTVKDNREKILFICQKAQEAIEQRKKLLILVPNPEAAHYIDELLWKTPEESFTPHVIAQTSCQDWIVISTDKSHNFNQAVSLLNLCSQISPITHHFEEVYELFDETNTEKATLSHQKLSNYKKDGFKPNLINNK